MQIKHNFTLLLTIFLIVLSSFVFSQEAIVDYDTIVDEPDIKIETYDINYLPVIQVEEDFTATSTNAAIDICVLAEQHDIIEVTNTGGFLSDYTLTLEGSASKYVSSVPNRFSLMPGETTHIINYFRFPRTAKGKYDLKVNIKTSAGLEKEFIQKVNSGLCSNNYILATNFNQTACPCLDMTYDFTIKNPGDYIETYTFGLDKFTEYANISTSSLVLGPGEEEIVKLTLNLDCSIYGDSILKFYSNAQNSGITMEVPILVNIDRCYDYTLKTGKILNNDEDKFNESFTSMKNYRICGGTNKSIQVMIDNPSYIGNNFFHTLEGPEWGTLYGEVISLNGYETGYTYLDLTPDKSLTGDFKFVINAASQHGNEKNQKVVDVKIIDCYDLTVDLPKEEVVCNCEYSEIGFNVQNNGKYSENVLLDIESPDYISLVSGDIDIDSLGNIDSKLKVNPGCDIKGKDTVKIKAFLENGNAYAEDTFDLTIEPISKCYSLKINAPKSTRVNFEETKIPVKITHKGLKKADYSVSIVGLDWVSTDSENFTLSPGEVYSFNMVSSPENISTGDYYIDLNINADNVVYQKKIILKLREGKTIFGKLADFIFHWRYWIYTGIILLIVIIALSFYFKEKARVWKIKKLIRNSIKKDEEKKAAKKTNKKNGKKKSFKWLFYLIWILILAAIVYLAVKYTEPLVMALSYLLAFTLEYIWYIIVGFLLLLVILMVLNKAEK